MRMGGGTTDVLLKGQFLEVTGSVALFEIKSHETLPGKSKPVDPACEFSFSLDQDAPSGITEKMGYSGRATILENRTDEDGMRTDTILLLTLDRNEGSIRLLSIPRDTYAPAYYVPKINSAYGAVGGGEKGMEQLMEQVKNVVGFMPDGYALVNLSAFVEAVDLLGGLDFDVPMDMDYDDPDQNLFIHLKAGEQHLTGEQLMWVVRFRSGYANADIGRTEVQRAVMKTAMKQWLRPKTLAVLPGLWRIYQENLTTDLSVRNIVWMARVLLKGMSGDIEANVLPGYATMAGDASVYMIDTYAASAIWPDYSPYK